MQFTKADDLPAQRAPDSYFTGVVWQERINSAPAPARAVVLRVTFEPGARTAWHTHPLGQTLFVVSGVGRFQTWGEPVRIIRAGDSIWIPPGEKHWHGAGLSTPMCHMAIQEALDGKTADWLEKVSDSEFAGPTA
jgi:quercetin dioxygenase-like cupin family protein